MFAKLLKYDWRATRPLLGVLCSISLTAAGLGGGAMARMIRVEESAQELGGELLTVLCVLIILAAFIAIGVCAVGTQLAAVWRFYKSRFTDEGYLTFTLPVTTHQILLSGFVNCLITMALGALAAVASVAVLMLLAFLAIQGFYTYLWQELEHLLPRLLQALAETFGHGFVWTFLLNIVCGMVCSVLMLLLSVTVGSLLASKHKILVSVAVYYGLNMGLSLLSGVLATVQGAWMAGNARLSGMMLDTNEVMINSAINVTFLVQAGLMLVISLAAYFVTHYLMDRKLNLN